MVAIGLIILLVAGAVTLDVVLENTNKLDAAVVGQTLTNVNVGGFFVAGAVTGLAFLLGLGLLLAGLRRQRAKARERKHLLRETRQGESAAAERDSLSAERESLAAERDRLAAQLEHERSQRARSHEATSVEHAADAREHGVDAREAGRTTAEVYPTVDGPAAAEGSAQPVEEAGHGGPLGRLRRG